jgi:hypothetical protein
MWNIDCWTPMQCNQAVLKEIAAHSIIVPSLQLNLPFGQHHLQSLQPHCPSWRPPPLVTSSSLTSSRSFRQGKTMCSATSNDLWLQTISNFKLQMCSATRAMVHTMNPQCSLKSFVELITLLLMMVLLYQSITLITGRNKISSHS